MDLKTIEWETVYDTLEDNVLDTFYRPALLVSKNYKRLAGYFSSVFLDNLVKEINEGINNNKIYIQIVCSPDISEEDRKKIIDGYELRNIINHAIDNVIDSLAQDNAVLPLVSELIAKNTLDIKFAIPKNNLGMFHTKLGIFIDENNNKIGFMGSNNETNNGVFFNHESFVVLKDWENFKYVDEIDKKFELIWNERHPELIVTNVSDVIHSKIDKRINVNQSYEKKLSRIDIEKKYNLYDYQEEAINAWVRNDYKGLLEMATGTGKTITALACYGRLSKEIDKLVSIIVVPQNELIYQWEEDIINAGGATIICFSENKNWENQLRKRLRRLSIETTGYLNILVTRDTFISEKFLNSIKSFNNEYLIIADEVHSFGSAGVRKKIVDLNDIFKYRLGISATPFRRDDKETKKLIDFFDGIIFSYSLKQAIKSGFLNNYEYHPKILYFDNESLGKYRHFYYTNKKQLEEKNFETLKEIKNLTSRIAGSSTSKVNEIKESLTRRKDNFKTIVYCSPGNYNDNVFKYDTKHIEYVSEEISKIDKVRLRMVRSQVDGEERQKILTDFKKGELNTLVAIKCLDQGINLPNVTDAYILSSTDSKTEFVQRRGRILRTYKGKPKSHIYDYIMLPQDYKDTLFIPDESDAYMIKRELRRMKEYSDGADNEREINQLIDEISEAYKEILIEEEEE